MLEFKMVENNNDFISYSYFPEAREDSGFITVNKKDGSIIKQSIAKTDEFKKYFFHMLDKIEEFIENKQFEKEGIIAWY